MGHESEAPSCAEDTTLGFWTYTSHLCNANGGDAECPQPYYKQHGRPGVQLVGRYACSASGLYVLRDSQLHRVNVS